MSSLSPKLVLTMSVAVVASSMLLRCTTYGRDGRVRRCWWQPAPQLVDSLGRPTAKSEQLPQQRQMDVPDLGDSARRESIRQLQTREGRAQREQTRESNEWRYKPELFTKVSIVSDQDVTPRPIELPRDTCFRVLWETGVESCAVVSALVDTGGQVKTVRFHLPSQVPDYDSAVSRSAKASVFAPLRSNGLRVEKWILLRYESRYSTECPRPIVRRY